MRFWGKSIAARGGRVGGIEAYAEFGSRMLEQEGSGGSIVNIGSTVIVRGSARAPQYAAAKYGIVGLTKSYAHAFAPRVRVNVFAPGSWRPSGCSTGRTTRTGGETSCAR